MESIEAEVVISARHVGYNLLFYETKNGLLVLHGIKSLAASVFRGSDFIFKYVLSFKCILGMEMGGVIDIKNIN